MGYRPSHLSFCFARQSGAEAVVKKARACRFATPLTRPRARQVGRSEEIGERSPFRRLSYEASQAPWSCVVRPTFAGGRSGARSWPGQSDEAEVSSLCFAGLGDRWVLSSPYEEGQVPSTGRPSSTSFTREELARAARSARQRAPLSPRPRPQANAHGTRKGPTLPARGARGRPPDGTALQSSRLPARAARRLATKLRASGSLRDGTRTGGAPPRGRGSTARVRARAS